MFANIFPCKVSRHFLTSFVSLYSLHCLANWLVQPEFFPCHCYTHDPILCNQLSPNWPHLHKTHKLSLGNRFLSVNKKSIVDLREQTTTFSKFCGVSNRVRFHIRPNLLLADFAQELKFTAKTSVHQRITPQKMFVFMPIFRQDVMRHVISRNPVVNHIYLIGSLGFLPKAKNHSLQTKNAKISHITYIFTTDRTAHRPYQCKQKRWHETWIHGSLVERSAIFAQEANMNKIHID